MSTWTKRQRLEAVLNGELADRLPVTCYHHFPEFEHGGAELMADTLLDFQKKYDWDFVKINPRAVYYYEAWGNTYDYDNYNDVVPTRTSNVVHDYRDLEKICEMTGKEDIWQERMNPLAWSFRGLAARFRFLPVLLPPSASFSTSAVTEVWAATGNLREGRAT